MVAATSWAPRALAVAAAVGALALAAVTVCSAVGGGGARAGAEPFFADASTCRADAECLRVAAEVVRECVDELPDIEDVYPDESVPIAACKPWGSAATEGTRNVEACMASIKDIFRMKNLLEEEAERGDALQGV
jgi:hypothetical protein